MNCKNLILITIAISTLSFCTLKDPNNGVQEEYYPNGNIKSQITIKNGLREGKAKNFDDKGRLLSEAEYKNDLKNGLLINYDSETGKKILEAQFKNDVQDGLVIQYYKEGMLFRKSFYKEGRLDSTITTYWPDGSIKSENFYKKGRPATGLKEFTKDGKIKEYPTLNIKPSFAEAALEIKLTGEFESAEFYVGDLEEGKFFNPKSKKLPSEEGKAYFNYSNLKKTEQKQVSVLAKIKTSYGNVLIMQKNYRF